MNNANMSIYVLDTSAWMTLLENEAGADQVQTLLDQANAQHIKIAVSFMTTMELYYIAIQEQNEAEAIARLNLLYQFPIQLYESTPQIGIHAAQIKAHHRVSLADAWILALAQSLNATLVHKDPEFKPFASLITMLELPYK